ncbi:hypothetical protein [Sanyastnella coralliicola]|uniref:hypothetical protein n=1 Tax=Sanyastnella coralliicola TaxID=3069118 RepID=UPI0027BAD650|nr:hypothetical protein [Longitalea sp. SCSIO 12813]
MSIEIIQIGISEQKDRTWGRVYIDYSEDGENKFIFRNYLKFEKKNFSGDGSFENEVAYTWFDSMETTMDYMAVLEGEYDTMRLTSNPKYRLLYGTPSKLLKSLIEDLDNNLMDDINKRRGWYNK